MRARRDCVLIGRGLARGVMRKGHRAVGGCARKVGLLGTLHNHSGLWRMRLSGIVVGLVDVVALVLGRL